MYPRRVSGLHGFNTHNAISIIYTASDSGCNIRLSASHSIRELMAIPVVDTVLYSLAVLIRLRG